MMYTQSFFPKMLRHFYAILVELFPLGPFSGLGLPKNHHDNRADFEKVNSIA